MSSKFYILMKNSFEGLAEILIVIALVLLSNLSVIGLATILHGIPFTQDTVTSVEQQTCINFTSWEAISVTTEKGYQFYWIQDKNPPVVGDEIWLSFWEAHLGWFHMGSCETISER